MRTIVYALFVLLSYTVYGQREFLNNTQLTLQYNRGVALPEYSFVSFLVDQPIQSVAFNVLKQTTGKNDWERLYKFPEYGFSFFYTNLGNDQYLGKAFALNYFFKINFISKEKWKVFNQTGIGLGYLTRKFDLEENYHNVGIGSQVNVHFNFRLGASYRFAQKWSTDFGLSFDHFSNGNTADPNLGLNNVTIFTGIRHDLGIIEDKNIQALNPHVRKNNFEIVASIGGKKTRAISSKYFLTSSLSAGVNREFFRGFNLGLGADLFYDESIETQMQAKGETFHSSNNFQTGIHLSQEFRYNRFSLILQEGIYLGLTNKGNNKSMYNRGIVQFQFNKNILLRIAMKSHLHILDYPEIGIGIKW